MAKITPFRALRPSPELASEICELPYDVFFVREARKVAERRPRIFLGNSKPEIGRNEGETVPSRGRSTPEVGGSLIVYTGGGFVFRSESVLLSPSLDHGRLRADWAGRPAELQGIRKRDNP